MLSFKKLSTNQYKSLVLELFEKMGFEIENIGISTEDDVNVILEYKEKPKNKKLFAHCHNLKTSIGKSMLGELNNLVKEQGYHKGIIVNTRPFTSKDFRLSDYKNIQIIDGKLLKKLIEDYGVEGTRGEMDICSQDYSDFDESRYHYLETGMYIDRLNPEKYETMCSYLSDLLIANSNHERYNLIAEEILSVHKALSKLSDSDTRRKVIDKSNQKILAYSNMYLYLIVGELAKSLEIAVEEGYFTPRGIINLSLFEYDSESKDMTNDSTDLSQVLSAYYQMFHILGYKRGENYIEDILDGSRENYLKLLDESDDSFKRYLNKDLDLKYKASKNTLLDIKSGVLRGIYIPHILYKGKKIIFNGFNYSRAFNSSTIAEKIHMKIDVTELDNIFDKLNNEPTA